MITIGDNIRMIKAIPGFDRVGEDFQITDILNGEQDMLTFMCGYGMGVISTDGFSQFFSKHVAQKWTDWENVMFGDKAYSYRTNGKRVMAKRNGVKASASCHPTDVFDLETGIGLCANRIGAKEMARVLG